MVNLNINEDVHFSIPLLAEVEVHKSLLNLDISKATGVDGLSHTILKVSAKVIAPSLTKSFNKSLASGVFPTKWKTSKITPMYKSGDHSNVHTTNL